MKMFCEWSYKKKNWILRSFLFSQKNWINSWKKNGNQCHQKVLFNNFFEKKMKKGSLIFFLILKKVQQIEVALNFKNWLYISKFAINVQDRVTRFFPRQIEDTKIHLAFHILKILFLSTFSLESMLSSANFKCYLVI